MTTICTHDRVTDQKVLNAENTTPGRPDRKKKSALRSTLRQRCALGSAGDFGLTRHTHGASAGPVKPERNTNGDKPQLAGAHSDLRGTESEAPR